MPAGPFPGAIDAAGLGGVIAAVLAVPASFVAWGQWTDRRERRRHRVEILNQLDTGTDKTLAEAVNEVASKVRHLEARERRNSKRLGRLRATQLEHAAVQAETATEMGRVAEALGRHLAASDEARRTLGLDPEDG